MAVTGKTGIFRMASNRSNGLILEDLDNGKKFFVSGRLQEFTPLDSVSIYALDENNQETTAELKQVFTSMLALSSSQAVPSTSAPTTELRAYFALVLPNFHRERVMTSDIKKIIKWFNFLNQRNLLQAEA